MMLMIMNLLIELYSFFRLGIDLSKTYLEAEQSCC